MSKPKQPQNYDQMLERHNNVQFPGNDDVGILTFRQNAILLEILKTQMQILEELQHSRKGADQ